MKLRIGHSPDPDDAFMWWPLANFTTDDGVRHTPQIDTRGYEFEHVLEDIESLNQRSIKGELEITAVSIHQYPYIADRYALTSCGSSMGDGYGPMWVSKPKRFASPADLKGAKLAIPGERTSAWLSAQLWLAEFGLSAKDVQAEVVMFDEIPQAIVDGRYDAGLLIHEGQITYHRDGLELIEDLGDWWKRTRNLPLPLGGNAIRRDLGDLTGICRVLQDSIEYALEHREQALAFALKWGRGLDTQLADKFVGMYVNEVTLDYGKRGEQALHRLLDEGAQAGLIPTCQMDLIRPA